MTTVYFQINIKVNFFNFLYNGISWRYYKSGLRIDWGTWVAQSVDHPTLDFDSGHVLMVMRSRPSLSFIWTSSLLKILSLFPSVPVPLPRSCTTAHVLSLSKLKINKNFKKRIHSGAPGWPSRVSVQLQLRS